MTEAKAYRFSVKEKIGTAVAAGLYPLLHYYNGNFDISDTVLQAAFMIVVCLLLPIITIFLFPVVLKLLRIPFLEKSYLSAINWVYFFGFLAFFIFHFNKKGVALVLLAAGLLGLFLYRHIKKVVLLQYLLAVLSFVLLLPKLYFMMTYDRSWTQVPDSLLETKFQKSPNIYVIQPDGYANVENLGKPPYAFDNSKFEAWLSTNDFVSYPNFRSNYYSTLTSNASMFAMKHHYYQNTYPGNLKTYGSQEVIVGENNVLTILKKNQYTTHLLTDNSFFLTNRKLKAYDYCNVPQEKVLLWDTGGIPGIDIVKDFKQYLEQQKGRNFYFIEKTIPSHIMYTEAASEGIERERVQYLERIGEANLWLKELITSIQKYDADPLIIIVADHGGYVGLSAVKAVENKPLNEEEAHSVFTSMLSIHWPEGAMPEELEFDSNVNLFRNLFSYLSQDESLLKNKEKNTSYLPLYEGFSASFYQCLDNEGNFKYIPVEE